MEGLEGLKNWSKKQGYILTGGGTLESLMLPGRDYEESDLPHYHLRNKSDEKVFAQWIAESRRSTEIAGAWSRPLFSGGWAESTEQDTLAFNLQTPSIFVDLRFPVDRPVFRRGALLEDLSSNELTMLARQHCFAGYSLPESGHPSNAPVFTRHHVIDWNFHPAFPRSRPNRWRVEVKADDKMCFKELSTAKDAFGVPVYFERWARYPDDTMGEKYFAARCKQRVGSALGEDVPTSFLVVVGNHFAVAMDRPPIAHASGEGQGGGPAWVDYLSTLPDKAEGKRRMVEYLSLVGSYGLVNSGKEDPWTVAKSTHCWLENIVFISPGDVRIAENAKEPSGLEIEFKGLQWSVLENSFSRAELNELFLCSGPPAAAAAAVEGAEIAADEQYERLIKIMTVGEEDMPALLSTEERREMRKRLKHLALTASTTKLQFDRLFQITSFYDLFRQYHPRDQTDMTERLRKLTLNL
jgi:hypothetical protein